MWIERASHGGGDGHSWPRRQGACRVWTPSLKRRGSEDRGASGRGQARLRMEGRGSGAQREVLGLDCKGGGGRPEKHPQGRRPRREGAQEGRHLVASPLLKGFGWSLWVKAAGGAGSPQEKCKAGRLLAAVSFTTVQLLAVFHNDKSAVSISLHYFCLHSMLLI